MILFTQAKLHRETLKKEHIDQEILFSFTSFLLTSVILFIEKVSAGSLDCRRFFSRSLFTKSQKN